MKIQLTIAINFISSKDNNEKRVMHSKSENIEIIVYGKVDEVIKELSGYQIGLDILNFIQWSKSDRTPCIISVDI